MKIEFNPDGSIKLPVKLSEAQEDFERKMRIGRCFKIRKEVSPYEKKCVLHITVSDKLVPELAVERVYKGFLMTKQETPMKLTKIEPNRYALEIGSSFRRCSECSSFIGRLRDFAEGNVIVERGFCKYEQNRPFAYEDFF